MDGQATQMATHSRRFPNESNEYREARGRLLEAERRLRDQVEEVAALRRRLPLGGELQEDYVFKAVGRDIAGAKTGRTVKLSQLFENGKNSLLVYSFMFSPQMKEACPMCTSLIDGYDATVRNLRQRANFAVVAHSPIERLQAFARERGWRDVRLLSAEGNTYMRDYHSENDKGDPLPVMNVFHKKDGKIHHSWASELNYISPNPGENQRHLDLVWPLWNLLDLTPEGRGTNWYPKVKYDKRPMLRLSGPSA